MNWSGIRAVVYDLDGTLVDSGQTIVVLLNELRKRHHLVAITKQNCLPWLSQGGESLIGWALQTLDKASIHAELQEFRRRYSEIVTPPELLFPKVIETLSSLRDHNFNLAICTNKPRILTEKILRETGLIHFFKHIQAGDDLPVYKPDPTTLLSCLAALKVSADQAILVGDSTTDQILADHVNVPFVHFTRGYNDGISVNSVACSIDTHIALFDYLPCKENG